MHPYTQKLMKRYYKAEEHPYRIYTNTIKQYLNLNRDSTVIDIGCGRDAVELKNLTGISHKLVGLDVVDFNKNASDNIHLIKNDIDNICVQNNTADLVISRSVLEHVHNPFSVYNEVFRILKRNGHFIFLTPNSKDYSAVISKLIPNRYHSYIVSKTEGRDSHDTFPTYYRSNSYTSIKKCSDSVGFEIIHFSYLGQYPAYFVFSPFLFLIGTMYDKFICKYDSLKVLRGWILAVLKK